MKEELYEMILPFEGRGERKVRVYVPARKEGENFPVIYMTDGQNLFDEKPEMFGCWHTREAVKAERDLSGRAAVIVGIHNDTGPAERTNELAPASIGPLAIPADMPEEMKRLLVPQGELFEAFLIDTVMPAVEKRFPVKKGRENTAFCGSSSGGLEAFYLALNRPDLFSAAGVLSPAFMAYHPDDLKRWIHSRLQEEMPYLLLYSGGGDELEQHILQGTELVYDILLECYPPEQLSEIVLLDKPHHESAWEPVFRDFLHTFLTRKQES